MTQATYLTAYPWLTRSPIGIQDLRRWYERTGFPTAVEELGNPKYQSLLALFLDWLSYNYSDAAGDYRKTLTGKVAGEIPEGWSPEAFETWKIALDAIYEDYLRDLTDLRSRADDGHADAVKSALATRIAAEMRNTAEDRGIDAWVDAVMAIGGQFAVKEQVNDAVTAFDAFTKLGWQNAQKSISDNVGAALSDYGPTEAAVRAAAAAYKQSGDHADLVKMTAALLDFTKAAQALGQAIFDTADEAVTWAKEYAADKHKENLANTNPELAEGLILMSTCVYVISAALGAAGIAFPPAAAAAGVVAALATGVKWLITKIDATSAVQDREHVKQMLTVQYGASEGSGGAVVKTITKIAGLPEKAKSALEKVETVAELAGDIFHSAQATDVGHAAKAAAGAMTTPLHAVTPLVQAADLSLELLEADPKQEVPRFNTDETHRLLNAIDTAYAQIDPSTTQVKRAESTLLGAVGEGRWSVLLVGKDGRAMGGVVDEKTMTFQPDREYALKAFATLAIRAANDRSSFTDDALGADVSAVLDFSPEQVSIGDYDAVHAYLALTARVTYTATVNSYSTSWTEDRAVHLYADGDVAVDWTNQTRPHIPARVYYPNLLSASFVLSSDHPYREYFEIDFDDHTPRHLKEKSGVTVPEEERDDVAAWKERVMTQIEAADEREARVLDAVDAQYGDMRYRD